MAGAPTWAIELPYERSLAPELVVFTDATSVWSADSRAKLRRIENFTVLYNRILANLGRK